jgi:hypothetical protein
MKKVAAPFLAAIAFCLACPVRAENSVWDRGEWPAGWPEGLEPLRNQTRTCQPAGPIRIDTNECGDAVLLGVA